MPFSNISWRLIEAPEERSHNYTLVLKKRCNATSLDFDELEFLNKTRAFHTILGDDRILRGKKAFLRHGNKILIK